MMITLRSLIGVVVLLNAAVAVKDEAPVRLAGGPNRFKGRVEVYNNGRWSTVCNKNFGDTDARLICRMLGVPNIETIPRYNDLRYGPGSDLVISELGCTINDTNVAQCSSGIWDYSLCKHSEDVAIDCQTPVYLDENSHLLLVTVDGTNHTVCSNPFSQDEADVICRMMGLSTGKAKITSLPPGNFPAISNIDCKGHEVDLSSCINQNSRTPSTGNCGGKMVALECPTNIRLVNGTTNHSGRVEIFVNDQWGTVCDDSFDDKDASVICRTLGLNPLNAISYGSAYYGRGNGSIIIDELECNGAEPDVSRCRSKPWLSHTNCDHDEDAGVECLSEVRLVDGPTHTSGRVEVKRGNEWLTFCDEDFTNNTATVICNMLGHRQGNVSVHIGSYYKTPDSNSVDYTPMCFGNESDIAQCIMKSRNTACSPNNTAGINCFSVTPIRLAGGWKSLVGKVEVFSRYLFMHDTSSKSWRSLCYDGFSKADAQVVCRMLGHPHDNPSILRAHNFYDFTIRGEGLSNLNCNGNEDDISDCLAANVWGDNTCPYYNFVGVNCDPVTPIRLVGGPSIRAGRVELMYNNTWGRVCGRNFDAQDRDVLCRMLGHNNGSLTMSTPYFSTGTGPYTVSNLTCVGTESDVSNCKSDTWLSTSYCSYSTVGIACKTPVRLVNGSYERSGRVEVYHNGSWGSICADAVDRDVANVLCRGVGFRFWNATVLAASRFGGGSLNILNNLNCSGEEADISMCHGGPWAATTCSQGAAAVDCRKQVTPIRLVDTGITPYSGWVEVYHNNKWGTISYSGMTKQNIDVLCLNLGYNFSRDASWTIRDNYICRTYMVNSLMCHGNESDVSECPSEIWDTQTKCNYSYNYTINCLTPISLLHGRTELMGSVQMTHNSTNGGICADSFTEQDGQVICSMLGYNYTRNVQAKENVYATYSNSIITGLNCTGDEKDINLCPSNSWTFYSNCSRTQAVGINCNTPVRLTDGPTPRVGKVQVMVNGTWARICFNSSMQPTYAGRVVCRELGYSASQVRTFENTTTANASTVHIHCTGNEMDISLCHTEKADCVTGTILGIACDTPLSLGYGRTKYMGQVQLSVSETGGISPNGLNDNDANHVCRILGHNFTRNAMLQRSEDLRFYSEYTYYTRTVVDRLHCFGNESDISDCIPNFERWQNRGSNSFDNMKINCHTPLRVINGQPYIHGEVQLFSNNTWMSVCADKFTTKDAYVVCRMMGHSHVRNTTIHTITSRNNKTPALLGGFQCTGNEDDLAQCNNMSWDTKLCDHQVNIDCRSAARIIDGPTPYEGRIELFVNNTWWPVCSYLGSYVAKVLCRTVGFTETSPVITYIPNTNNISLSLTYVNCVGSEQTISECSTNGWTESSCSSIAKLSCYTPTEVEYKSGSNIYNGRARINPLGNWQYICADTFDDADAKEICLRLGFNSSQPVVSHRSTYTSGSSIETFRCLGNESDVQGCNHSNWKTSPSYCSVASVNCHPVTPTRLVGGPNNASGRVEVFYQGRWGTVCDDAFDDIDASVFCRMLGYKAGMMSLKKYPGLGPIIIDDLACTGLENDVSECPSLYWEEHNCGHGEDVAIECSDQRVKLTGGQNKYRGHVEIQYFGQWYTVCSEHIDHNDTDVICRELGVVDEQKATIYRYGDITQSNSGTHRIQDLMCKGSEDSVDQCQSYPWNDSTPFCSLNSVAINCRPQTRIYLVGGLNKYSGRVVVEYPLGNNGTICDYDFDEQDAQVICRSLGYNDKSLRFHLRSFYRQGPLNATISHLQCDSRKNDISECGVTYDWGSPYSYCNYTREVGIECDTPIRLYGGRNKYMGRLEVYYQGHWGTVCSQGFDKQDARTVCTILGLNDGSYGDIVFEHGVHYDTNGGNVLLHDLECTGDEGDLHECGTLQWTSNSCSHDQDVTLNCRAKTEVRLMEESAELDTGFDRDKNKFTELTGRVEVKYDGEWGSICNDHFDDDDAYVLCRMMKFSTGNYWHGEGSFGPSQGQIIVDDLYCSGNEHDVSQCPSREWTVHDCGHDEDVAIHCIYEKDPDPCLSHNHRQLPFLDYRYINFNTQNIGPTYNDTRLVSRWYFVGKEPMPDRTHMPSVFSCGTKYPIYQNGPLPDANTTVEGTACQVTETSNCIYSYSMSIKHCANYDGTSFYVYRLEPTYNESGYCFGVGTEGNSSNFVAEHVKVISQIETYSFACDFTKSNDDLFYSVIWEIHGDRDISLTKGYCNRSNMTLLDLTEKDLIKENMKMDVRLVCSVRAYTVPGGPPGKLSSPSPSFYAGIQILTPSINMRRGETKAIEFRLTVPFRCDKPGCSFDLVSFTPDYGNCQNVISHSSGMCGFSVREKDVGQIQHMNISSGETGQYGVGGHYQVFLQTQQFSGLWKDIKLPAIEVTILPEADRKWRGKLCAARNDPHMYTFDGKHYEHHVREGPEKFHTKGTFILYKNIKYETVEIQHRVTPCTTPDNPTMCNCGVAVKAGRDVYVISVCDSYIDIGYKHCGDNSLTVKKEDDMTYTIYLPYGTAVRARIDIQPWMGPEGGMALDLTVHPSLHDEEGNSRGLCGNLDDDPTNDFHDNTMDQIPINIADRLEFISKWKVPEEYDMFSPNVNSLEYRPWLFPVCVCNPDTLGLQGVLPCVSSVQSCSPGVATGTHSCPSEPSRTRRSLTNPALTSKIPIPTNMIAKPRVKRSTSHGPWTNETATHYCEGLLHQNKMYNMCAKVPSTHTDIALHNCVLDILLTNGTDWSTLTLQSMQDTCISVIKRNTTVRETDNNMNVTDPIYDIVVDIIAEDEISCKFNCNGLGVCNSGMCECNHGFGGVDCSVDISVPPSLSFLSGNGLCDKADDTCDTIVGHGGLFVDKNLTCQLKQAYIDFNGNPNYANTIITDGQADSLISVLCSIPTDLRRNVSEDAMVTYYDVSVSNTEKYGHELRYYVYDSSCQTYAKQNDGNYTFSLKNGTCHIAGHCYKDGDTLPKFPTRICRPELAVDKWTILSKTEPINTQPITGPTTESKIKALTDERQLVMRVDYQTSENLKNVATQEKYQTEAYIQLETFYRKRFSDVKLTISNVRYGSLIIEHAIFVNNDNVVEKKLLDLVVNGTKDTVVFFGQISDVMELSYLHKGQACDIYQSQYDCDCEVTNGRPRCRVITGQDKTVQIMGFNVWMATTSALAAIIIVLLIVLVCHCKKGTKTRVAVDKPLSSRGHSTVSCWEEDSEQQHRDLRKLDVSRPQFRNPKAKSPINKP